MNSVNWDESTVQVFISASSVAKFDEDMATARALVVLLWPGANEKREQSGVATQFVEEAPPKPSVAKWRSEQGLV